MKAEASRKEVHAFRPTVGAAIVFAVMTMGCGYTVQARDDVRPKAVPAMRLAQTLNPDAGKNRKVVSGLDADAARNVDAAYVKSFERKDPNKTANDSFTGTTGL